MYELFPRLDKRFVRRLLRTGTRVSGADTQLFDTAIVLERLGLVEANRLRYIKCAYPSDEDYRQVSDPGCQGVVELDAGPPYGCPECGRTIAYPDVEKEVFEDLYLVVSEADVLDYLVRALVVPDTVVAAEPVDDVGIKVRFRDGRTLIAGVVDFVGTGWRARGADAGRIHAYVIASPDNRPDKEVLERAFHIELADILSNDPEWLGEALDSAAQPRRTAFISYAARDWRFVDRLAEDLVAYGVGVWLDRWKIRVGESISERMQQGLDESDYLLVTLSPNSVKSSWVGEELNADRIRQLERRHVVIIPVLYKDCEIPPLLADKRPADFRNDRYEEGLRDLLTVLAPTAKTEPSASVHWGEWRPSAPDAAGDRGPLRRALLRFITKHYSVDELRTLCFDLDVVYDDLPARVRKSKARELIVHMEKRGRLPELIALLREDRPVPFAEARMPL
jgi:hypothetical protein